MADKILKSITFPNLPDKYIIPETTVDAVPTQGSTNAVQSGGVHSALDTLQAQIPQIDSTLSQSGQAADAKVVGDEITDLKSAINNQIVPEIITLAGWHIVSTGAWALDSRYDCEYFMVQSGDALVIAPNANGTPYAMLKSVNLVNGGTPDYATGYSNWAAARAGQEINVPSDANYIIYRVNENGTSQKPSSIVLNGYEMYEAMYKSIANAESHLDELEETVGAEIDEINNTLTQDENILLNIRELDVTNEITPTMTSGLCSTDGTITASTNYEYTQIMPVKPGDVIHCKATALSGQTAPTNPCYIRFVTAYLNQTAVESAGEGTGQTQSYTVPTGVDGVRLTLNLQIYSSGSLIVYHETTEINKSAKYEGIISEVYGHNLINEENATNGVVQSDGSINEVGAFATYKTSEYIPVKSTKTYKLYVGDAVGLDPVNETRLIYLLYNSNRQALTYTNQLPVNTLTISPATDGFVRVCANDSEAYPIFGTKLMLIEGTNYVPYEPYSVEKVLNNEISPINDKFLCNVLKGKKWCPCGDSFTEYTNAQFIDGKYSGRDKTYPYLIALRNDMLIDARFFKSGRTLAYPADGTFTNSLTCPTNAGYYQNIPADVDYVTIMLGINDCQHTGSGSTDDGEDATGVITLGTIDDTTTATYYGAYNTVLSWLRENRPFAHVGVIVTNGTQLQDYTEAQIAVAKKWGYPYINLNGDERTPAFIRCYNPNIPTSLKDFLKEIQSVDAPSNTHPNWKTHELESTAIESWLRTL